MEEVKIFEKGVIDERYFELTPTGLVVHGNPPFEVWERAGKALRLFEEAVLWWWGDLINDGEKRYGEMYSQALDESDYEYETLRHAVWVASRIEMCRRKDNLSYSHHLEVAALEVPEQDKWLELADKEGWGHKTLRKKIKESVKGEEIPEAYCFVSDTLECLARHYYKAFVFESDPEKDEYAFDCDWSRQCKGNCPALELCRCVIENGLLNQRLKDMTISINKKRREKGQN